MSAGESELDAMIAKLRAMGDSATEEIAKVAAPLVQAANRQTAEAHTTPDGIAWAPRKNGGAPVLVNAAQAVEAVALGTKVRLRLVGTSTGDQRAQAIQNHTRPILPAAGRLGQPITDALTEAARHYFNRSMGR